jgi:hypothetical protein
MNYINPEIANFKSARRRSYMRLLKLNTTDREHNLHTWRQGATKLANIEWKETDGCGPSRHRLIPSRRLETRVDQALDGAQFEFMPGAVGFIH